ncbi:MAG: glutaredoxin domain-containing protein [Candidatus Micrarchaeota archaeon]
MPSEDIKKPAVLLYSTPTCPYCLMAKEFLRTNSVPYSDFDVSTDRGAYDELLKKSGQSGVPIIDVGGTVIIGFDEKALRKALGL